MWTGLLKALLLTRNPKTPFLLDWNPKEAFLLDSLGNITTQASEGDCNLGYIAHECCKAVPLSRQSPEGSPLSLPSRV